MALISSRDHLLLPWRSRRTGHCELFTLIAVQTERGLRCGRESPRQRPTAVGITNFSMGIGSWRCSQRGVAAQAFRRDARRTG